MKWIVKGPGAVWVNTSLEELCRRDRSVQFISTATTSNKESHR